MNHAPKKSQLNSREEMIRIALLHPAGLETQSFAKVDAPPSRRKPIDWKTAK